MAKKNQPQTGTEQKVQTRYDRKMEARRKQEEKDKREAKMLRIGHRRMCASCGGNCRFHRRIRMEQESRDERCLCDDWGA